MTKSAVVLAGGFGTRLRSVLPQTPKSLAPVGTQTFLEILLEKLFISGIDDIVLALGYKAEDFTKTLHKLTDHGRSIRTVVESTPRGTGGAIANAMRETGLRQALVVNGDTYLDGDICMLRKPLNMGSGELCRMAVVHVADRTRYGGIQINEAANSGQVRGFTEKGSSNAGWINAGYYHINAHCFEDFAARESYSFEQLVLPALVERGHLTYAKVQGELIDIGVPADYRRFCSQWASRNQNR